MSTETSAERTPSAQDAPAAEPTSSGTFDLWGTYLTGPAPREGGVNWEAYSHDELYQMLWQDADVADVSMVATEWAQHRAALNTHAEVLREQRAVLLDSWHGPAAEDAVARLDALATRVEKISELARAGQQAAQDAADALAMARAMMPPPPGGPGAPAADPAADLGPGWGLADSGLTQPTQPVPAARSGADQLASWAPDLTEMLGGSTGSFSPTSLEPNFADTVTSALPSAPATAPASTAPASGMNTAFGAAGGGGFSFYAGSGMQDMQKAQAVRAMRTYESSLMGGSQLIGHARGAIPAAAPTPRSEATAAASNPTRGANAGVPWARLVGSGQATSTGVGSGMGYGVGYGAGVGSGGSAGGSPGVAGPGVPFGPGPRIGAMPGVTGGPGVAAGPLAAEAAAARGVGHGGMVPPVGASRGGSEDERHENQLPTIDHGLFAVEVPTSAAVIGPTTGERQ